MTDIVEQTARVLSTQTTCDGKPYATEVHRRQAQALADAGLLAQPARTVPTREEIVDVQDLEMSLDRVVIRDADGDIYERQGELETERGTYAAWLGTHTGVRPSIDIKLPATVIYVPGEIVGDRPTRQEVWQEAFSAGYMDGQTYTVPTRGEIAEALAISYAGDAKDPLMGLGPSDFVAADAILELLTDQPTVEDVRLEAIAEERLRNDNGIRIPLEELQVRDGK